MKSFEFLSKYCQFYEDYIEQLNQIDAYLLKEGLVVPEGIEEIFYNHMVSLINRITKNEQNHLDELPNFSDSSLNQAKQLISSLELEANHFELALVALYFDMMKGGIENE